MRVSRYVTPLREGGSLPAIVEADDDGMYVLKFRGAGQGPKALVAELVSGEIARALEAIDAAMADRLTPDIIAGIVELIPDQWLGDGASAGEGARYRAAYGRYLLDRLASPRAFVDEAVHAR